MENFVVTTKYILPEMVKWTVQFQRFAPSERDKKVVCASYLKQHSGSDKSLCRSLTLFYSGSEIHCVMFSFWRLLEAFGKLKQMGNREGTFCRAGVPSAVPPTAVASVTRHYRGFLSTLWRPAVVTLCNCT